MEEKKLKAQILIILKPYRVNETDKKAKVME
jgi:hypothetical protein